MSSALPAFCLALLAAPALAGADSSTSDDRLALSVNGGSLTNSNGGAGASVGWLHNFDADTLVGLAAEHQALDGSHWTFGSLSGALTRGAPDARYTLSGEVHEGAGRDAGRAFHYRIEALGLTGTYFHRLSLQLEDRQIDVETTRGNLPKAGVAYLWNPHLQTTLAYAYSFGGNLDTRLTVARIDLYSTPVNFFFGGAWGHGSPIAIGPAGGFPLPARRLREGYVGLSKTLLPSRSELTLVADYQDLPDFRSHRTTFTLNYIFHLRPPG